MGLLTKLASGNRAVPHPKAGLGMSISPTAKGGPVKAATTGIRWSTPGQPMYQDWDATRATQQGYLGHTYVMRCVRLRAETLAGLPFHVGPDPDNPSVWDPNAKMAQLLGPPTPSAPGGPNSQTTSRALWIWSWVQRIVTGRMAWELQLAPGSNEIVGLWPLVSACLDPVPSAGGSTRWFDSYVYHTPDGDIPMKLEQVFYDWRMSAEDPRQAESVLQSAALPVQLAIALDKYMWGLLSRGMTASKLVLTPGFEQASDERAWQDQWLASFSGFDNTGATIFGTVEADEDETTGKAMASVQVIDLAMKGTDAQMLQTVSVAKSDINIALGVPESLIGNASERVYANADAEERIFWTTTGINDVAEAQDAVNLRLGPTLQPGMVGWFDLSRVATLQPATIFQPPAIADAINLGIITAQQATDLLGIPAHSASGEDTSTAPIGEVTSSMGAANSAQGGRSDYRSMRLHGRGSDQLTLRDGWGFRYRPVTSHTHKIGNAGWGIVRLSREQIRISSGTRTQHYHRVETPELASETMKTAARIRRVHAQGNASTVAGHRSFDDWFDANSDRLADLVA